jgi:hypothetical protein
MGQLFLPSFSDLFFLAVIVWLFLATPSGWQGLLADGDAGWHIRTGQYILAHHAVPHTDLFSFSKPGAQWFAWEWLSDVVFALLFGVGGLKGLVLFCGVWIGLFATLLLRYSLWCGANSLLALPLTLLAIGASGIHFLARPHLFTLLLLPASIWVLQADRREHRWFVWLLVPLTCLWANLHGGFLVLIALLGLMVAGAVVEAWLGSAGWAQVRRYALLLALCGAATFLNPYGAQLHGHILDYIHSDWIRNTIMEFQSPTFRSEAQSQFEILLLAGLVAAGFLLIRRRWTETLWLLFLAHSSLVSVRHAPLYAAVAAPILAATFTHLWRERTLDLRRRAIGRIFFDLGQDLGPLFGRFSVWGLVGVLALVVIDAPIRWPKDFPKETFPTEIAQRYTVRLASARVLTTDQWADYLIFKFYPQQRVFFDGRSDFYGETLGRQYLSLMQGSHESLKWLRQNQFNLVLIPVDWPLSEILKRERGWRVVEDDGHAILFELVAGTRTLAKE